MALSGRIKYFIILAVIFLPFSVEASFGVVPAHPRADDVQTQSWFVYHIEANKKLSDGMLISNHSAEITKINIYAIPAELTAQGSFIPSDNTIEPNASQWVILQSSQITLGPGESQEVPFTLKIPAGIKAGQYVGAIIAESIGKPGEAQAGENFNIQMRAGVRMYVYVEAARFPLYLVIILCLAMAGIIAYVIVKTKLKNKTI